MSTSPAARPDDRSSDRLSFRLPVLMYHSVPAAGPAASDLQVPLGEFATHLSVLRDNGFTVVGLTRAVRLLATGCSETGRSETGRARPVALTFDDGYVDFLAAAELLAARACAATLYVSTNRMGGASTIPGSGRLLTWDELEMLPREWVEIGSHSHDHRPLDVLDYDLVAGQARASAERIAERAGGRPVSFCYPHGYCSAATARAVRAAGYTNACIVGRRVAGPGDDLFMLPRLQVRPGLGPQGLLDLVARGEPGWTPRVKRLASPGWRSARRVALRLGRELT
jgi:peptidoglycan/xylan/chitin deacetylase (PgdA/CDA1 family)